MLPAPQQWLSMWRLLCSRRPSTLSTVCAHCLGRWTDPEVSLLGLVVYADRGEGGQEGGRGVSGKPSGGCCQRSLVHVSRELCSPATLFARAVCVLFVIGW